MHNDRNSEKGKLMRYCFALTYLCSEDVDEVFCLCELVSIQVPDDKISGFADYLLENYVDTATATFPPNIWACASTDL